MWSMESVCIATHVEHGKIATVSAPIPSALLVSLCDNRNWCKMRDNNRTAMSCDNNKSHDNKLCSMTHGFPPKPCVNFQDTTLHAVSNKCRVNLVGQTELIPNGDSLTLNLPIRMGVPHGELLVVKTPRLAFFCFTRILVTKSQQNVPDPTYPKVLSKR